MDSPTLLTLLAEVSLRAALLSAPVALATGLLRRRHPALATLLCRGLLLAMLALPLLQRALPAWTLTLPWAPAVAANSIDPPALPKPATTPAMDRVANSVTRVEPRPAATEGWPVTPARPTAALRALETVAVDPLAWQPLAAALYFLVTGLLLLRLILGSALTVRLAGGGQPVTDALWQAEASEITGRRVRLRLHPAVQVPMTSGWYRPVILLPEAWVDWDDDKRRCALLHEALHIRQGDALFQALAALNRALYWFHPLAWWLPRVLLRLAEHRCDAQVLAGGADRHRYARYLLEMSAALAGGRRLAPEALTMAATGPLESRLRAVLDTRPQQAGPPRQPVAAAVVALLILAGLGAAAVRLEPTARAEEVAHLPALPAPVAPETSATPTPQPAQSRPPRPAQLDPIDPPASAAAEPKVQPAATDTAPVPAPPPPHSDSPLAAMLPIRTAEDEIADLQSSPPPSPRLFILFFDDLNRHLWGRQAIATERVATEVGRWLETELQPGDLVAVVSYRQRLRLHTDFTGDLEALDSALNEVARRRPAGEGVEAAGTAEPSLSRHLDPTDTSERSARDPWSALERIAEAAAALPGAKTLVLFTTGFGNPSLLVGSNPRVWFPAWDGDPAVPGRLRQAGVAVHVIDLSQGSLSSYRLQGIGTLAEQTGGGYFRSPVLPGYNRRRQPTEQPSLWTVTSALERIGQQARETAGEATLEQPAAPTDRPPGDGHRFLLLFDDLNRVGQVVPLDNAAPISAARTWVERDLAAGDTVAVLSYRDRLRVHQDYTSDRAALVAALDRLARGELDEDLSPAAPESPSLRRHLPAGELLAASSATVIEALERIAEAAGELGGDETLVLSTSQIGGRRYSGSQITLRPSRLKDLAARLEVAGVRVRWLLFQRRIDDTTSVLVEATGARGFQPSARSREEILTGLHKIAEEARLAAMEP